MEPYSIMWVAIHGAAFTICLLVNALIGANYFARFEGSPWQANVGDVAAQYYILIQPYTTAFSIWAVIFFLQAFLVILQVLVASGCCAYSPKFVVIQESGRYRWSFLAVQLLNAVWVLIWCTNTDWGVTVDLAVIYLLLASLVYAYSYAINAERNIKIIGGPDTPLFFNPDPDLTVWENIGLRYGWAIYVAWVAGASVLGTSIVLKYIVGIGGMISSETEIILASVTLVLVGLVFLYIVYNTGDYIIGLVYTWTSIWIAVEVQTKGSGLALLITAVVTPCLVVATLGLLHYLNYGCAGLCRCEVYTGDTGDDGDLDDGRRDVRE